MPLSEADALSVASRMLKLRDEELTHLNMIHAYLRGRICKLYIPKGANSEYRELVAMSRWNVMTLVVNAVAQNLFAEGYRGATASENAQVWSVWQANRMDARQAQMYRAALTYGFGYATVLPGSLGGASQPVITPFSPRSLTAAYADPANDEWPLYAISVSHGLDAAAKPQTTVRLFDATNVYRMTVGEGGTAPAFMGADEHGLGVTPVVRWRNEYGDVDDGSQGEVEPLIPLQDQLNQTTWGLLIAQQYAAFRQRWAIGMQIGEDENGNPKEPFNAAVNRLWVNEDGSGKFGEFEQTDLSGYLESRDSTLRFVSATAQVPPQALMAGSSTIANISAEGLAAIEAGLQRKVAERKVSFGESDEQLLRLCGKAMGDEQAWEDTSAQIIWRDTESRSLAQVADALGKMATMLAIPPQALWERLPGVTPMDVDRWKEMAQDGDAIAALERMINAEPAGQRVDTGAPTGL